MSGPKIWQCHLLLAAQRMALPLAFCSGGDYRTVVEQEVAGSVLPSKLRIVMKSDGGERFWFACLGPVVKCSYDVFLVSFVLHVIGTSSDIPSMGRRRLKAASRHSTWGA